MLTKIVITFAASLLLLTSDVISQSTTFDITAYGAKADGSDAGPALASAWKEACAATTASQVVIPAGTFAVTKGLFEGPCKAPINFQLQGTLQAPADPSQTSFEVWLMFQNVDFLTISGGGTVDGQGGAGAWKTNTCSKDPNCWKLPYNLGFYFVTNSIVSQVTTLNSKSFHVNVIGSNNLTFTGFTITAPADSPNTDGIHIGRSTLVNVIDTNIKTGDDCISVGDTVKQLTITGVTCGPGHGISVGSLGKYQNEGPVEGVFIKNCSLLNTMTGIRIKSWPGLYEGAVTDFHAEDVILDNVGLPILIDQRYCPWNQCNIKASSNVKISKASFKNIRGTSQTPEIIYLDCSATYPCDNVEIADIDITYAGAGGAKSLCSNVKPISSGTLNPPLCSEEVAAPMALRGSAQAF